MRLWRRRSVLAVPSPAGLFAAAVLLAVPAGLASCATIYNPATGRTETVLNTPTEIALGNIAKAQMGLFSLKMGKLDPAEFDRVQRIGQALAKESDRKDVPYRFGVIRDEDLNAFALPGGTIYVYSGLLEKATDDELASVLGHEIGHVAARHAAKHLQSDLGFMLLLQIATAAGADPQSAQVGESLYDLFRRGYSRADELQADRLGLRYTMRAGYNPDGMLSFFEKLLEEQEESALDKLEVWNRTHPLASDRITEAKKELERLREGATFCPECGRSYPPKKRFCAADGTPLKKKKVRP